jgi:ATP-binding protein involved in chromosome partitioning
LGRARLLTSDLPPGTGDVALTISQKLRANGSLIVTTPQEVALMDVYKSVSMNQKVGIPITGIVENASYFICDGCDKRHELYGSGGGQKVADLAGVRLLAQLPIDPTVRSWGDAGTPVVQAAPNSPISLAFLELADRFVEELSAANATGAGGSLSIDRSGGVNRHLPVTR